VSDANLQLIGIPHAGGGASAFADWPGLVPEGVAFHALELPGHGARMREPLETDFDRLVERLAGELADVIDGPYALFGHSLGALLAFEVARALRDDIGEPAGLLVAGRNAPSLPSAHRPIHHLPDDEFVAALRGYGGLPEALSASPELLQLFLPALRADITLAETYQRRPGPGLRCPVTAFSGRRDPLVDDLGLVSWRRETTGPFTLTVLDGGHFFLGDATFRRRLHDRVRALAETLPLAA
jgi:surfactin synthase thioesterase subunit